MRTYNQNILEDEDADDLVIYTIEEWNKTGHNSWDGMGFWAKDGFYQENDYVFHSEQEDATHIVWFNK